MSSFLKKIASGLRYLLPRVVLCFVSLALVALPAELLLRKVGNPDRKEAPRPLFHALKTPRNSSSYHEFEYPKEKAANEFRIAVVGDSFSEGGGISIDDIYPKRLERYLNCFGNSAQTSYQVINFSTAGRTTVQEVDLIKELLGPYRPDLIIIGYCINDPEETKGLHDLLMRFHCHPYRKPKGLRGFICQRSALADFLSRRISNVRKRHGFKGYYHYLYADEYIGWTKAKAAWAELGAISATSHVPVVVTIFPLFVTDMGPRYAYVDVHNLVHQVLEDAGIQFVDLMPFYLGTHHERLELEPGKDPHPSEVAHRIAAEALWVELLKRGLVPSSKGSNGAAPAFPATSPYVLHPPTATQGVSQDSSQSQAPTSDLGVTGESEEVSMPAPQ